MEWMINSTPRCSSGTGSGPIQGNNCRDNCWSPQSLPLCKHSIQFQHLQSTSHHLELPLSMFCVTSTVLTSYQVSSEDMEPCACRRRIRKIVKHFLSRSILLVIARIAVGHSACSPNYCHGRCWYVFASWWVKCLSCQTWRCWSCRCLVVSILRHKRWYTHENQETKRPKRKQRLL